MTEAEVTDVNETETADKGGRPKKVDYTDLLTDEQKANPDVYPFREVPADYDPGTHAPLKKKDFAVEWDFYNWKAEQFEAKATKYREMAADLKENGGKAQQKNAERLQKMAAKVAELKQKLRASGYSAEEVEAILTSQG